MKHQKLYLLDNNYETSFKEDAYKVEMKLTINQVKHTDFGTYHCVSKNPLGATDGSIKVYSKYNHSHSCTTHELVIFVCIIICPQVYISSHRHY